MSVLMMMAGVAAAALATGWSDPKPTAQGVAASAASAAVAKPTSAKTKYCVLDTPTGSRIERKICHTRKDWLNRGFDPLAPKPY